ncbi:indole-3-glycerol phosphate synthase TrpC [Chloroflexota bacterium]
MLNRIVVDKRGEVEQRKKIVPVATLEERMAQQPAPLDFAAALGSDGISLIAEVKKASPSRGILCPDYHPVALAKSYQQGGASAISVLTEVNYFQGSMEHLAAIKREVSGLPLLRKDFIFDPYQVYESRAGGADALLLIVAILDQEQLDELLNLAGSLGLGCLVEVHNENEVERALLAGAEIIGINNRDLSTFDVDIDTTRRLRPLVPPGKIVVSESGIGGRSDVERVRGWGVNAVLVGETLVTADDIGEKIRELML